MVTEFSPGGRVDSDKFRWQKIGILSLAFSAQFVCLLVSTIPFPPCNFLPSKNKP